MTHLTVRILINWYYNIWIIVPTLPCKYRATSRIIELLIIMSLLQLLLMLLLLLTVPIIIILLLSRLVLTLNELILSLNSGAHLLYLLSHFFISVILGFHELYHLLQFIALVLKVVILVIKSILLLVHRHPIPVHVLCLLLLEKHHLTLGVELLLLHLDVEHLYLHLGGVLLLLQPYIFQDHLLLFLSIYLLLKVHLHVFKGALTIRVVLNTIDLILPIL